MKVSARGEIARHVDDAIGAMVYSMIGQPPVESQLQHHLFLSQNSVKILHAHLKELKLKYKELELRYDAAKTEASMNAAALRQKIGEYDDLKVAYDQLLKECELFGRDTEIFADAAEDAEERRAEADRKATEAEERAKEAEQRERAALSCIENLLKSHSGGKYQVLCSADLKSRLVNIKGNHNPNAKPSRSALTSVHAGPTLPDSDKTSILMNKNTTVPPKDEQQMHETCRAGKASTPKKGGKVEYHLKSSANMLCKDSRGTKRVLFDASKSCEEIRSVVRQRVSKNALINRKFSGTLKKVGKLQARNLEEKENVKDFDAEVMAKIEEAALSDNETAKYLADLLIILKKNLEKAETEGDLLYTKYCDIHKLLMDTLEMFGVIPELHDRSVQLDN
ncbi:hypothetical protein KP509_20G034600 [Ceratopteris richardii]|uniref:Uncharacterized protein n=1 Tax=Ceratopteris richardii TaxID=49495 RepID=A0A8T2SF25_CERRI|nr:hypothetical protein KP509_20G034600 [Ceratopteris richardii]